MILTPAGTAPPPPPSGEPLTSNPEDEILLPFAPRVQLDWNRQNILYLQPDSESLALDSSVYYTLEAKAREVQDDGQPNVSVLLQSRQ